VATTIKSAFREFASNLNITDRQTKIVTNCKNNMVSKLGTELKLHPDVAARVIGSWDRDTLTRYLSEGDVDVMVVLHYGQHKDWDNGDGASKALGRFKKILDAAYPKTPCRVDQHCVTMKLKEFRLDVVPAFQMNDGSYSIPDTHVGRWTATNPVAFANSITETNKNMNGTFVPLIKMVKGWNRESGWPIKSFHLECMLYSHYRDYTKPYTYSSTLKVFFEALPEYLASQCYDPIAGERVDSYMDGGGFITNRARAIAKAKAAAAAASDAFGWEGWFERTSIEEWKALLGEFFPSYG
jgi:hypothetical protein